MSKFKVGDKVRCTNDGGQDPKHSFLWPGEVGVVVKVDSSINGNGNDYQVQGERCPKEIAWRWDSQLELAEDPLATFIATAVELAAGETAAEEKPAAEAIFDPTSFYKEAAAVLVRIARRRRSITTDHVWASLPEATRNATPARYMGAFMVMTARTGLVVAATKRVVRSSRTRGPIKVWSSKIFKQVEAQGQAQP